MPGIAASEKYRHDAIRDCQQILNVKGFRASTIPCILPIEPRHRKPAVFDYVAHKGNDGCKRKRDFRRLVFLNARLRHRPPHQQAPLDNRHQRIDRDHERRQHEHTGEHAGDVEHAFGLLDEVAEARR